MIWTFHLSPPTEGTCQSNFDTYLFHLIDKYFKMKKVAKPWNSSRVILKYLDQGPLVKN